VASIERAAYPRFKRAVSDRELHESFTPGLADRVARELTRSPEHCLALVVWLKSFQRLGYFPDLFEVPLAVVEHVGVSVRKLPGAAIGGISPGQRTATAALWHSRQRPVRQTISVVASNNSRVCGS
jgi:hypothetical protein